MRVADPTALALALGLLAGPLGAALARRGRRLLGAGVGGALGALLAWGAPFAAGAGAATGAPPGALALAAAAGAAAAIALPGLGLARFRRRSFGGTGFGRAAFAGGEGEARLPARCAGRSPSRVLDGADRLRLERAIYEAEEKSALELVVALARRCGRYEAAGWRAAAWLAALALAGAAAFAAPPRAALAGAALAALAGHAAARAPRVRRFFVGEAELAERAAQGAFDAFARAGLLRAPASAGLLLFVPLFEARVVVLGGEAVQRAAGPRALDELARGAAAAIAAGRALDGLLEAAGRAAALAAEGLPPPTAPRPPGARPNPVRIDD